MSYKDTIYNKSSTDNIKTSIFYILKIFYSDLKIYFVRLSINFF